MSVEIIKEKGKYIFNQEAIDCVVKKYQEHKGSVTIQKELKTEYNIDVSIHGIYLILHNRVEIRDDREQALKYTCDDNFFKEIDTEEKAYWLGFLYADGYINNKRKYGNYKVGITISESDKVHLEKFKNAIHYTGNIKTYSPSLSKNSYKGTKNYCRILITSSTMAEDLINKGCFVNKTDSLIYPSYDIVPKELEKHFIRGIIDGDGSLIITNLLKENVHKDFELSFTGTKNMCQGILRFFNKENAVLSKRHKDKDNDNFSFSIGGNKQVLRLVTLLYKDATIYLDRKYEKYLKMLEISREQQ